MRVHANAKLGPAGRLALVLLIEGGCSLRTAAAREFGFGGHRASVVASLAGRHRRRRARAAPGSRIVRVVRIASRGLIARRARGADLRGPPSDRAGDRGWSPARPASRTQTVWKVLRRHGISRRPPVERGAPNRYEWPRPGDLLHMDVCTYARFRRPGHRATGDRSQRDRQWMAAATRVGYDYAHAVIDDHSRLAYVELHDDERAATVDRLPRARAGVLRRPRRSPPGG